MLRSQLQDAAVSTAKASGHDTVEARHVVFAIARRFRNHGELGPLLDRARAALEPPGRSHTPPAMTEAATVLLASISTELDAVTAALSALRPSPDSGTRADGSGPVRLSGAEAQPAAAAQPVEATRTAAEDPADIMAELDGLVGLGPVKAQVRSVIAVVEANMHREKAGLAVVNPSLHLVFTGPPGTGKTTVARLVARLYGAVGALPGTGFIEATRADLVAGYVGQTAIKTTELINRTRPGVLFIDEAYALAPSGNVDFGNEAIATLVKAMEDHRSELALVVAGYADEMADFIGSNPGLRSRFRTYIDFPDYSAAELLRIFQRFTETAGLALTAEALDKAAGVFAEVTRRPNFGNARFARSLFEQAYARMASRAAADGRMEIAELTELQAEDITLDAETLQRERPRIGFLKNDR